jgi:hypothetical protein
VDGTTLPAPLTGKAEGKVADWTAILQMIIAMSV